MYIDEIPGNPDTVWLEHRSQGRLSVDRIQILNDLKR